LFQLFWERANFTNFALGKSTSLLDGQLKILNVGGIREQREKTLARAGAVCIVSASFERN
jgi:hypothetical protein